MNQTALQTDLSAHLENNLPPLLTSLIEKLKQEGIYLEPNPHQEKSSQWLDDKAIQAMHEAIRHATALMGGDLNVAEAARHLEKIQVAAAVAEKTAFITHTKTAKRCSEAARHIAHECRTYFHDMKSSRHLLRKN